MRVIKNPEKSSWNELVTRPSFETTALESSVTELMKEIKLNGDEALKYYTRKFDSVELGNLKVTQEEIDSSESRIDDQLKNAIKTAVQNIETFHKSQICDERSVETSPGVKCWRKKLPIEKVGLYVPGGTAPLFSSLLMLGIPAKLAKCEKIVVCTPPQKDGSISNSILYCASLLGISEIFKIGGAQSIAAMTYGTESIPSVNKIFGPGNQYVTMAKSLAQKEGISIDMPAGPSEVLVIADDSGNPEYIASDLLSQAEHGEDSQVVFLCNSERLIPKVIGEIENQLSQLPRKEMALKALSNSLAIYFDELEQCFSFSNEYAPEHLILALNNAESFAAEIKNAGSVFLGPLSCESAGDYASGTNHTLPTNAYAKSYSGVNMDSFYKSITFQQINQTGLKNIGEAIETMAEAEGLLAHKNAVSIRLKDI